MAKEVGLAADQIAKIDKIYEKRQREMKPKVDEYLAIDAELQRLMKSRTARPEEVEAQARRLMYPRFEIDVSRYKMLYEMSLVMTADQVAKMEAMFDRQNREFRALRDKAEQEHARGRGRGNLPRR